MPEEYQRVSALEHVLLRPDTYVGSTEGVEWTNTNLATHHKVVPALYKIFDEVLVNAGDNITTGKTTSIEVNITVLFFFPGRSKPQERINGECTSHYFTGDHRRVDANESSSTCEVRRSERVHHRRI